MRSIVSARRCRARSITRQLSISISPRLSRALRSEAAAGSGPTVRTCVERFDDALRAPRAGGYYVAPISSSPRRPAMAAPPYAVKSRRCRDRRDHLLHQHLESAACHGDGRSGGEEGGRARPDDEAVGQGLASRPARGWSANIWRGPGCRPYLDTARLYRGGL